MAAIVVPLKSGVSLKLDGGRDTNGNNIVRSVAVNGVKPAANGENILNVAEALAGVLTLPVLRVEHSITNSLERDG